jgi:hypothetical protein
MIPPEAVIVTLVSLVNGPPKITVLPVNGVSAKLPVVSPVIVMAVVIVFPALIVLI